MKAITLDREAIYRKFWEHTDKKGFLVPNQLELAEALGMDKRRVNYLLKEFVQLGRIKKSGHDAFLLYDPDKFVWGPDYVTERTVKLKGKGRFT